jgi:hypothetical protein
MELPCVGAVSLHSLQSNSKIKGILPEVGHVNFSVCLFACSAQLEITWRKRDDGLSVPSSASFATTKMMKTKISIALFLLVLCASSAVHAQSTRRATGFMETKWGMGESELTTLYPGSQLSKRKNKYGDVVYEKDYSILTEKSFSAQFMMDDAGGLKQIQFLRPAKTFEKDTYQDLFAFLKKQYGFIGTRTMEDDQAAYVIDTFATADSSIKLVTISWKTGSVSMAVLYQPK